MDSHLNTISFYSYKKKKGYKIINNNLVEINEYDWLDKMRKLYEAYDDNDEGEYVIHKFKCTSLFSKTFIKNRSNKLYEIKKVNDTLNKKVYEIRKDNNGNNGKVNDTLSEFEKAITDIFGENYTLIMDWRFNLIKYFISINKARGINNTGVLTNNIKLLTKKNGEEKRFIERFNGTFKDFMTNNGFTLVTNVKEYIWKRGKANEPNYFNMAEEIGVGCARSPIQSKLFAHRDEGSIVITDGDNVVYLNVFKQELQIYRREDNSPYPKSDVLDNAFNKINELGLRLYTAYKAEAEDIRKVFGEDFVIHYK